MYTDNLLCSGFLSPSVAAPNESDAHMRACLGRCCGGERERAINLATWSRDPTAVKEEEEGMRGHVNEWTGVRRGGSRCRRRRRRRGCSG